MAHRLRRGDDEIKLEPKVMQLLTYLAGRHGEVVSRRELEAEVWSGALVTDDAVTRAVIKLRKALGDDARHPRYVETIAKTGYRLIATTQPDTSTHPSIDDGSHSDSSSDLASPATSPSPARSIGKLGIGIGILVLTTVLGLTIWWLVSRTATVNLPDLPALAVARPVIAVLPFENISANPEQDYFSDGITEDLITELSKLSGLQVVARSSTFAYRDGAYSARQIGQELGANYIVRGSVQRAGGRLRINVRLTDAMSDRNRWAERYDRELADVFRVQDEITIRVVSALQVELAPGERQRLTREYSANVEAYDQFLQGLDFLGRRSNNDNLAARAHFERAIELEPSFARAYSGLAMAYAQEAVYDRGPKVREALVQAEILARKGLQIDDSLPQLRFVVAMVEMFKGNLGAATAEVSRAIELKPSYADGFGLLARILHFAGRPGKGLEAMDQAIKLNPRVPAIYRMVKGSLLYQLGKHGTALRELQTSVEVSPNLLLSRLYLTAVYAATGQLDAAQWEVEEILALNPEFTLYDLDYGFPVRDPELFKRFLNDLQRAGLSY